MPADLISPRVLTPEGLLVFGGAPKVGKSDFLISLLFHMAAGVPFLNMRPPRPLRVFYLQMEIGYHYLKERVQSLPLEKSVLSSAGENIFITPQLAMFLNEEGVETIGGAIKRCFPSKPVDIIAIDPLRCVFDGGSQESSENDNTAMMFFLQNRLGDLRRAVNPEAGIILTHHTRKMVKKQFEEEPFQAFSGASALRAFYTTGMVLYRPDEEKTERVLSFELRNGVAIPSKLVDKQDGRWVELDRREERVAGKVQGRRNDAERERKNDIILQLIREEAKAGRLYTANQFALAFEGKGGLESEKTIKRRIEVLATNNAIRFVKDTLSLGYPNSKSKLGVLCVKNMKFLGKDGCMRRVYPSHYKKKDGDGQIVPVPDPYNWEEGV